MEYNKITTDALTLYGKPDFINEIKDTYIYISYSNYTLLKDMIVEGINKGVTAEEKNIEKKIMSTYILFIQKYDKKLREDYVQTDPLLLDEENNVFMIIQKDVKDISGTYEGLSAGYLSTEENDTIYTALLESTELLTINSCISDPVKDFDIPVFTINIAGK